MSEQKKDKQGLIQTMASRLNVEPKAFELAVKKSVGGNLQNEEFLAFCAIAHKYDLDPFAREVYAIPKKGGGIQVVVGIDGWYNIINSHRAMDGIEVEHNHGKDGELFSCTCRIFRKDRSKPIACTEYFEECNDPKKDTWQRWPHRMLQHKAVIQCARMAFGLSGICDPDEAERMSDVDVTVVHAEDADKDLAEQARQAQESAASGFSQLTHEEENVKQVEQEPKAIDESPEAKAFYEDVQQALLEFPKESLRALEDCGVEDLKSIKGDMEALKKVKAGINKRLDG